MKGTPEQLQAEARAYLLKFAESTVYYLAVSSGYRRDMAKKYSLTEQQVESLMAATATKLVDDMKTL